MDLPKPTVTYGKVLLRIVPLLKSGAIKPIVAKTFPLAEAANALHYLIEDRPFGMVVLTI